MAHLRKNTATRGDAHFASTVLFLNVFVGVGDSTTRCLYNFYPLPSLPTLTKNFILYSVSAFSFYLKKKTPAKEKQTQGFAPRPRERRAAVHSLCYSVGSSAHSPVNSLRSNSTGSCGLQSKPSPRSSQLGCTTAARLLEACSSGFIKSFALLFPGLQQFIISNVNHRPQGRDMFSARVSLP